MSNGCPLWTSERAIAALSCSIRWYAYPVLALKGADPYTRLRERLGWRGSFEPEAETSDAPKRKREQDEGVL